MAGKIICNSHLSNCAYFPTPSTPYPPLYLMVKTSWTAGGLQTHYATSHTHLYAGIFLTQYFLFSCFLKCCSKINNISIIGAYQECGITCPIPDAESGSVIPIIWVYVTFEKHDTSLSFLPDTLSCLQSQPSSYLFWETFAPTNR